MQLSSDYSMFMFIPPRKLCLLRLIIQKSLYSFIGIFFLRSIGYINSMQTAIFSLFLSLFHRLALFLRVRLFVSAEFENSIVD